MVSIIFINAMNKFKYINNVNLIQFVKGVLPLIGSCCYITSCYLFFSSFLNFVNVSPLPGLN